MYEVELTSHTLLRLTEDSGMQSPNYPRPRDLRAARIWGDAMHRACRLSLGAEKSLKLSPKPLYDN